MSFGSLDDLVEVLRRRVAEREAAGEYPPGLEESLDRHFRHIAVHETPRYDYEGLRSRIAALAVAGSFRVDDIAFDTRLPGGSQLHRAVAKIVSRQTAGVLAQVQRYADAVHEVLAEILGVLETPAAHTHGELDVRIAAAVEALAAAQRAGHVPSALAGLEARVAALESDAGQGGGALRPQFAVDAASSSSDQGEAWYEALADDLRGSEGRIVDLACGDGWFLRSLRERHLDAIGVERDPSLVRAAREDGLTVEQGEAVVWLERVADGELGGICLLQVVDLLRPQEIVDLVVLSLRKLRPGGRVLITGTAPPVEAAGDRHRDPAAGVMLHPAHLQLLFREAGFGDVTIDWTRSPAAAQVLFPAPGADDTATNHDAEIVRLNQLLFAAQDYALVARR